MHDEDAFLRAVQAAPDDGDLLLIYADWLDERGDSPRADFLRLREAMKKVRQADVQHVALWRRMHELRIAVNSSWLDLIDPRPPWDSPFLEPELVERIRRRPGLYIGDTSTNGLHNLLFNLIEAAADEMNAGRCHDFLVELLADGACRLTTDGLPLDVISGQLVLATRDLWGVHDCLPLHSACALSTECRVEAVVRGECWRQDFQYGIGIGGACNYSSADAPRTSVVFRPDPQIFTDPAFQADRVIQRLELIGHLSRGRWQARVLEGQNSTGPHEIAAGNLTTLLAAREVPSQPCCEIIDLNADSADNWMHVALRWTDAQDEQLWPHANYYEVISRGNVVDGLRRAIGRAVRQLLSERGRPDVTAADYRSGLRAAVSILARHPGFLGSTRTHLHSPEIAAFVYREVRDGLTRYFREHAAEADRVCARVLEAREQRLARRQPLESK